MIIRSRLFHLAKFVYSRYCLRYSNAKNYNICSHALIF